MNLMKVPVTKDRTFPEERHETGFPCREDRLCGTEKAYMLQGVRDQEELRAALNRQTNKSNLSPTVTKD